MFRRHHFMSFPKHSKEQALEQIYHGVASDITRVSALGHTSFVYQPHLGPKHQPHITTDEMVQALRDKLPHFVIHPVQKGILVDWS
jgi:hypothetical protein